MKKIASLIGLGVIATAANAQIIVLDNTVTSGGTSNFAGLGFRNGGAATDPSAAANTTTRMIATRVTPVAGNQGLAVTAVSFAVANLNTAATNARMRIRYYADNNGAPGTYLTGSSFANSTFATGITLFSYTLGANTLLLPTPSFWVGIVFDNNSGTATATSAELDNLGVGLYNAPTVGTLGVTSASSGWRSTGPTNGLFSNIAGSAIDFGNNAAGSPVNWGLRVTVVPEPGTMAALGLGALALLRRRKKA